MAVLVSASIRTAHVVGVNSGATPTPFARNWSTTDLSAPARAETTGSDKNISVHMGATRPVSALDINAWMRSITKGQSKISQLRQEKALRGPSLTTKQRQ